MSDVLAQQKEGPNFRFINFALFPEHRAWLHERITLRFEQMLTHGFVDEVKHLQHKWNLNMSLPSMRCVGYRQVLEYLQGDYDFDTMRDKGISGHPTVSKTTVNLA